MEKYAWRAKLKEGKREEYIKRHNEIWQEMKDVMDMPLDKETGAQPHLVRVFDFN